MLARVFLPLFIGIVLFSGCRENYKAEKAFWRATQDFKKAGIAEMEQVDLATLAPIVKKFKAVTDDYPDTSKGRESLHLISKIYVKHGYYEHARSALRDILSITASESHVTRARFQIAELYEMEGQWPKAEPLFWSLAEDYALNDYGLKSPLKILQHYKKLPDHEDRFAEAYQRTHHLYRGLLKRLGPITRGAYVQSYVASAYLLNNQWKEARDLLVETAKDFPEYAYTPTFLIRAGDISASQRDFESAAAIYQRFVEAYPKNPNYLKTLLKLASASRDAGQYAEAIGWYEKTLQGLRNSPESDAKVKLELAKTYQLQNNWAASEELLLEVAEDYGQTKAAQGVPLLFAAQFYKTGQSDKADAYLEEAIQEYRELETTAENAGDIVFFQKLQNIALVQKGDWQGFLENIDSYFTEEKQAVKRGQWLFLKALITEQRLQDPQGAANLYRRFIREFPNHPLAPLARTRQDTILTPTVQGV